MGGVGKQFKRGQSGNPAGRPKGVHPGKLSAYVRDYLESEDETGKGRLFQIVEAMYTAGLAGDVNASRVLLDRAYGKPIQTLEAVSTVNATQTVLGQWLLTMGKGTGNETRA